jgi:hypothetical protein
MSQSYTIFDGELIKGLVDGEYTTREKIIMMVHIISRVIRCIQVFDNIFIRMKNGITRIKGVYYHCRSVEADPSLWMEPLKNSRKCEV